MDFERLEMEGVMYESWSTVDKATAARKAWNMVTESKNYGKRPRL